MSTAELEQLLRLNFQVSEDGFSDLEAILYISDLLAKRNGPCNSDAAWQQFQTQYRPYADGRSLFDFSDEEAPSPLETKRPSYAPSGAGNRSSRRLRRLAVLAAILAALLLGGMVAQAAGLDVFGTIARWTDETFRFMSAGSINTSGSNGSQSGQEDAGPYHSALQAIGMDDLFPTWPPRRLYLRKFGNYRTAQQRIRARDLLWGGPDLFRCDRSLYAAAKQHRHL